MSRVEDKKIALLRGINVGGHRPVRMLDLKQIALDLGYLNIKTYLQSGNLLFQSDASNAQIEQDLSASLAAHYPFDIPVIVRDAAMWNQVVAENPFVDEDFDHKQLHVCFVQKSVPLQALLNPFKEKFAPDRLMCGNRALYIRYDGVSHRSKLNLQFLEKQLGSKCTARNWRSLLKIQALLA